VRKNTNYVTCIAGSDNVIIAGRYEYDGDHGKNCCKEKWMNCIMYGLQSEWFLE
jgi:hypothetical protein